MATPPDAHIDPHKALAYWTATPATTHGILGGYPHVSRLDLRGSRTFLTKLRRRAAAPVGAPLPRAVDCGAGIGRVTLGLLAHVADAVDVVEPVARFTDRLPRPHRGDVFNVRLEDWRPARAYDLVWNQWCLGQLPDAQLVAYLRRVRRVLAPAGWIVVKENLSVDPGGDVFDPTDHSVTRTDGKFRAIFGQAGLTVVATELQRGMPRELYPVRAYALQPC